MNEIDQPFSALELQLAADGPWWEPFGNEYDVTARMLGLGARLHDSRDDLSDVAPVEGIESTIYFRPTCVELVTEAGEIERLSRPEFFALVQRYEANFS